MNKHIELPALSDDEIDDLSWSEFESAVAMGISVDSFKRLAKTVRNRMAAAIAAYEEARVVGEPVASDAFTKALSIRAAQGWELTGKAVPVLYTDAINGEQVCRDDLWICTTAALASPPAPLEAQAGMVLVPREPTEDMLFAAEMSKSRGYRDLYRIMLAAAPVAQPATEQAEAPSDDALMRQAMDALDRLTKESMASMTDETMATDESVSAWNDACLSIARLKTRLSIPNTQGLPL